MYLLFLRLHLKTLDFYCRFVDSNSNHYIGDDKNRHIKYHTKYDYFFKHQIKKMSNKYKDLNIKINKAHEEIEYLEYFISELNWLFKK